MNQEAEKGTPMVTLKTVDRLVGLLIVGIILFGTYSWWRATRRALARDGMMGQMMNTMPGMDPIWYLFGMFIAVSVVLGVYAVSREQFADVLSTPNTAEEAPRNHSASGESLAPRVRLSESPSEQSPHEPLSTSSNEAGSSALTFLPEDERRVIEPILESPGLTQVELRGARISRRRKSARPSANLKKGG